MKKELVIADDLMNIINNKDKDYLSSFSSDIKIKRESKAVDISVDSIFIGQKYPEKVEHFKMIFIVSSNKQDRVANNVIIYQDFRSALLSARKTFILFDKRVLLYLGKFPNYGVDIDGGSILARQLIDTLKCRCKLDLVFIRKHKETYSDVKVNNIRYVEYLDAFNNKFIRRLENLETNQNALKNYHQYDYIITAHISKFFGMDKAGDDFWSKTILFPMFCTSSYKRAGEDVPAEYTDLERIVVEKVKKIITPAIEEKKDLINDYNCLVDKIKVIPRGISKLILPKIGCFISDPVKLICIGSIKPQKNNVAVIDLLNNLNHNSNHKYCLHLVYTIQDNELYKSLIQKIKDYKLENSVVLHEAINQEELAELLKDMDFNISVSNWETFGRGIFEGVTAGLPTLVFDKLTVVKDICGNDKGIFFTDSISEMEKIIIDLTDNKNKYIENQNKLKMIADKVTYHSESLKLAEEIFYK